MSDNKFKQDLANNNFSIETTRERTNKTICPRTVADAVYITEDETLADRLNNISNCLRLIQFFQQFHAEVDSEFSAIQRQMEILCIPPLVVGIAFVITFTKLILF